MKCKILTLALVFTVLMAGAAVAQNGGGQRTPPTTEQRLKRWNDNVFSKLDLKNDQQAQLNKIFTESFTKMDSVRNAGGERPSREVMQKMNAERDDKVKAVLSADQFKKYQDLMQEQMQQMRQRGGGQGQGGGGNAPQQ
jgi:Spy/CpxP family protein refolding chaperone